MRVRSWHLDFTHLSALFGLFDVNLSALFGLFDEVLCLLKVLSWDGNNLLLFDLRSLLYLFLRFFRKRGRLAMSIDGVELFET